MEIYYSYVKKRKDFGKHAAFTAQEADVLFDLRPNEEYAQEHIERNPGSVAMQAGCDVSAHEANTDAVVYADSGMVHTEGGWPKEVDSTEAESVIRFKKKIEKDEQYIKTVVKLAGVVEGLIKCNNAIDIYEQYFPEGPPEPASSGPATTATVAVLRDPTGAKRGATYLAWHPDGGRRLAVAYSIMEFQKQPPGMPLASAVWDLANPNTPETLLQPTSQATCINYNLKDHNVLGAGLYNGQFAVFDPRKGSSPVECTPLLTSHKEPVFDFAWQLCKTGTEAMTVSTDGNVLWWDIRRLGEPLESLTLLPKGGQFALGAMSLDYTLAAGPTKFIVGTDSGVLFSCNRKGGKTPADRITSAHTGHHGPAYGVMRHPTFSKYFLSVGDWTARLWAEDLKAPVITSPYQPHELNAGRWSPTRPGVFLTARGDGVVDIWDYFDKQHEPVLSTQVSSSALMSLRVREGGGELAVGCVDGTVTVMKLSAALYEPQPNERATIAAMFERECNREKTLEKVAKENKAKARKAADASKAVKADGGPKDPLTSIAHAEAEFYRLTGIKPPEAPAMAEAAPAVPAEATAGEAPPGAAIAALAAAVAATPAEAIIAKLPAEAADDTPAEA